MITIRIHPSFSPFISISPITGRPIINDDITSTLRGTLYMSLSKALDSKVKTEIGWDNIDDSDGVAILKKLEEELGLKQDSTLDTIDLLTALNHTKKDKSEKLSSYHRCFKHSLEECLVNNVMPFTDNAIIILYLRNMQEPCLTPTILNLEQGTENEWSSIRSLDDMYVKAKKYIKAYLTLHPSSSSSKTDDEPKKHCNTEDDEAYKKRVRRLMSGLRGDDPEKITKHLLTIKKLKPGGCFIHDHSAHKFFSCKKVANLCEQANCTASLKAAIAKALSNKQQQPSNSNTATLSARRAKAQLKKDRDEVTAQQQQVAKQQKKLDQQME